MAIWYSYKHLTHCHIRTKVIRKDIIHNTSKERKGLLAKNAPSLHLSNNMHGNCFANVLSSFDNPTYNVKSSWYINLAEYTLCYGHISSHDQLRTPYDRFYCHFVWHP